MLGEIEQDQSENDRQPDGDAEAEKGVLTDRQDEVGDAGEDHLPVAEREGEAAQEDAGAEGGDERADLEPDRQDAVDDACNHAGDDHGGDDHFGTVSGLTEDGAEHGEETDHVAERQIELTDDQRHDGREGDAADHCLDDKEIGQVLGGEETIRRQRKADE